MQKVSTKGAILAASAFAALAAMTVASTSKAAGPAPEPTFKAEKCYGIAASGKNDCASSGSNSCAGTATKASDPKAWIYVPAGTCSKIQGASLKAM
jgi:uncharacterized membrane protein